MPIYEYKCEQCHEILEVLQRADEEAPEKCVHCGAQWTLKKIVSNSSFHLKGGGWYKDLYSSTKPNDNKASTSKDSKSKKPKESASKKKCNKT
ncbi:MAG: zinc ribbon domain-containing protein [Myxococcales bacterium]|nr:zinc ribbon domain-containing protein [Myxococcales bacterium]USN51879.1 MAG: zinc ribbon domain-containing protein [Myxococcales bacterium]